MIGLNDGNLRLCAGMSLSPINTTELPDIYVKEDKGPSNVRRARQMVLLELDCRLSLHKSSKE